MNEKKKTDEISDLMAAKEEAKRNIRMLTDEELDLIAGGKAHGDERDMSETLADIDGLTDAGDGFC